MNKTPPSSHSQTPQEVAPYRPSRWEVEELIGEGKHQPTPPAQTRQRSNRNLFVKGPIPVHWFRLVHKRCSRSASAWAVAIALWHVVGFEHGRTKRLRLSTSLCSRFGISRFTKRRGLTALEQAHLVSVDRQPGKATVVTLLQLEEPQT